MNKFFNEVMFRRIMALLLCVCMVLPLCAVTGATESTEPAGSGTVVNTQETTAPTEGSDVVVTTEQIEIELVGSDTAAQAETTYTVLAGSDFQQGDTSVWAAPLDNVNAILTAVKKKHDSIDGFLFCGDYTNRERSENTASGVRSQLQEAVQTVYPDLSSDNMVFLQGNHENNSLVTNNILAPSGANDKEGYGVFVIHEKDYMWYTVMNEDIVKNTAENLREYLDEKIQLDYAKPIFVVSHLPLHYSMRTKENGDAMYANYIFDVLNKAASKGLNIIFLFGHDHSNSWDDHLGGSTIYLAKGDSINIAQANRTVYKTETLNFTYMNAGYVGYFSTTTTTGVVENELTMSVFTITGNDVTINRYTANGVHELKAAGVLGYKDSTYGYSAVNTEVYSSPQTVTLDTSIDWVTDNVTLQDSSNYVSATITRSGASRPDGFRAFATYDIIPASYTEGETYTLKVPVDTSFDLSLPVLVIDHEKNTIKAATISGEKVVFTTDHFSQFSLAQAEAVPVTASGTLGKQLQRATSLEAGVPYIISDYDKNWVMTYTVGTTDGHNGFLLSGTPNGNVETLWYITEDNYIVNSSDQYLLIDSNHVTVGAFNETNAAKAELRYSGGDDFKVYSTSGYLNRLGGLENNVATQYVSSSNSYWHFDKVLPEAVASLTLIPTQTIVSVGGTAALVPSVQVNNVESDSYTVAWSTSDTSVATVDDSGVVTGVKTGVVKVTCTLTAANGGEMVEPISVSTWMSVGSFFHGETNNSVSTTTWPTTSASAATSLVTNTPYVIKNTGSKAVLTGNKYVKGNSCYGLGLVETDNSTYVWYYSPNSDATKHYWLYDSATAGDNYLSFVNSRVTLSGESNAFGYLTHHGDGLYTISYDSGSTKNLNQWGGDHHFSTYVYSMLGNANPGSGWNIYEVIPGKDITFTVTTSRNNMNIGDTLDLSTTLTVDGTATTDYTVTWTSSQTAVATVDDNGKVTAINGGDIQVYATLTAIGGVELAAPITMDVDVRVAHVSRDIAGITVSTTLFPYKDTARFYDFYQYANYYPESAEHTPSGPFVIYDRDNGADGYAMTGIEGFTSTGGSGKTGLKAIPENDFNHLWYYDGKYLRYGSMDGDYVVYDAETNQICLGDENSEHKFDMIFRQGSGTSIVIACSTMGAVHANGYDTLNRYGGDKNNAIYVYTRSSKWYFYKVYTEQKIEFSVDVNQIALYPRDTVAPAAALLIDGEEVSNYTVEWSSANTSVATVGEHTGLVQAIYGGETTITATLTAIDGVALPDPVKINIPTRVFTHSESAASHTSTVTIGGQMTTVTELTPGNSYILVNYGTNHMLTGNTGAVTSNATGLEITDLVDDSHLWYYDGTYLKYASPDGTDNYLVYDNNQVTLGSMDSVHMFNKITHLGYGLYSIGSTSLAKTINQNGGASYNAAGLYTASDNGGKWWFKTVGADRTVALTLFPGESKAYIGQTTDMTTALKVDGVDVSNYKIIWSTKNTAVATVDNGKVYGTGEGTVTITAKIFTIGDEILQENVYVNAAVTIIGIESMSPVDDNYVGSVPQYAVGKVDTGISVSVKYTDGTTAVIPVTLDMLVDGDGHRVSAYEAGTQTGLQIKIGEMVSSFENGITLNVIEPDKPDYPAYPNEGSVLVDKTGTGIDFQASGLAQIELSTTGVPVSTGADIIVMLDTSSSMGGAASEGSSETRLQAVTQAMNNLVTVLQAPDAAGQELDIRIAVADFNRYWVTDTTSYYYINPNDGVSDCEPQKSQSSYLPEIYTGNKAVDIGAFVNVNEIGTNPFYCNGFTGDTTSKIKLNKKSGTNYDYAFDMIYQLATVLAESNSGKEHRDLFVIFMSDGAPFQYNYFSGQSGSEYWNNWLLGDMDDAMYGVFANKEFFNDYDYGDGVLNNKHWMAEAIKGDPRYDYPVIRKNDPRDLDQNNFITVAGMGATMYTIGFGVHIDDNNIRSSTLQHVISKLATDEDHYFDAPDSDTLKKAFRQIAGDIRYSATNGYFVDTMGEYFDLQIGDHVYTNGNNETVTVSPAIEVRSYDLFTHQDVMDSDGTLTNSIIGTRKTDSDGNYIFDSLEIVTFSADGTAAYSDKLVIDSDGDGVNDNNILSGGVINAKTFWYNNNSTVVTIDINGDAAGGEYDLAPETFYWKVGTISNYELVLSYYVYLEDALDDDKDNVAREEGIYDTNDSAILYYTNYLNHKCFLEVETPKMPWKQATVGYGFYLVDELGNSLIDEANNVTGSFAKSIKIGDVVYKTFQLNTSGSELEAGHIVDASNLIPSGYTLYDAAAKYTVQLGSNGIGYYKINTQSSTGVQTTYVTGLGPLPVVPTSGDSRFENNVLNVETYNYTTANTVVWFALVAIKPDTVVVDYGLSVDVNVLKNDLSMTSDNSKIVGLGASQSALTSTNVNSATYNAAYGTASYSTSKWGVITYTPNTMTMPAEDVMTYKVQYTKENGTNVYYYSTLTVIPATTIYYEDNFLTYTGYTYTPDPNNPDDPTKGTTKTLGASSWVSVTDENKANASSTQEQDRPGDFAFDDFDADNIYGYDGAYTNMTKYSLGSARKFTASCINDVLTYGRATFTFKGTGFDVISLTSGQTGTITVQVKGTTADATTGKVYSKSHIVDTYYGYKYDETTGKWVVSEYNGTTGVNADTLYQIPVIKVSGLTYDTYTVTITASYNDLFNHAQYGYETDENGETVKVAKYDFYLDAIRIYDPANDGVSYDDEGKEVVNSTIQNAYKNDKEGWPEYFELRNLIISRDALDYTSADSTLKTEGIVFIDNTTSGGTTYDVEDYMNYGPNNELYLAPGQAIAFDLNVPGDVAAIHMAMKSVGNTAKVKYYTLDSGAPKDATEITTATDLYYDITSFNNKTVIIRNVGSDSDAVLSITNVKVTYNSEHTDSLENSYFEAYATKVNAVLGTFNETASDDAALNDPAGCFDIVSASVSLEDEVLVNFYYTIQEKAGLVEIAKIEEMGLLAWSTEDAMNAARKSSTPIAMAEQVSTGYLYDSTKNRYMVQTSGIAAKNLGDDIYAVIYVIFNDGTQAISRPVTYSPKTYAMNMLGKSTTSDKMKMLCVAMLNYGAAAQTNFGYKTGSLMNAGLTAEQKALVTSYSAEKFSGANATVDTAKAVNFVDNDGFSAKSASVSFEGALAINYYFTPSKTMASELMLYYWSAEDYTNASVLTVDNATGSAPMVLTGDESRYWADITGIAAKEIDQVHYVAAVYTAEDGTTYCSGVIPYSVSKYCVNQASGGDDLAALAQATAMYGYHAKVYFDSLSAS